jgi:tRNA nucleotidyltransferase/poly(A) polymerase
MDILCTVEESSLLKQIATVANGMQLPCFLIGGFVRDKILNRNCKDIDVVCLGNGIDLAHAVAKTLKPSPKV